MALSSFSPCVVPKGSSAHVVDGMGRVAMPGQTIHDISRADSYAGGGSARLLLELAGHCLNMSARMPRLAQLVECR
jgi:hypothetical protein